MPRIATLSTNKTIGQRNEEGTPRSTPPKAHIEYNSMQYQGNDQDSEEDRHQPFRRIQHQPNFPIVIRVLRLRNLDVTHKFNLVEISLEPGVRSDHEQVNQGRNSDECGIGDLELLMKLFRLLIGKTGQRLRHGWISSAELTSSAKLLFGAL
jgi:hypothetical protein